MAKNILIPLPSKDFDPTETAIPWGILRQSNIAVTFATPDGSPAKCDERMLTGAGLGVLAPLLAANKRAREAYLKMSTSSEFMSPQKWTDPISENFDGILLPGGHAKGMREYLESKVLQMLISDFFKSNKPVGAICHGVVLACRSRDTETQKSVLWNRKTTALLSSQELLAWRLTRLWLGDYYRTYEQTVEDEVIKSLSSKSDFLHGPAPLLRDDPAHLSRGYVVIDRNYISARWPGDAHRFAQEFVKIL